MRLAYDLGRRRASGRLRAGGRGSEVVVWVRSGAAVSDDCDALGRRVEARLSRMAELPYAEFLAPRDSLFAPGRLLPLVPWARRHVEQTFDGERAERLRVALTGKRLAAIGSRTEGATELEPPDQRILAALRSPRELAELAKLVRAPRFQLLSFVSFLATVGALDLDSGEATRPASPKPNAARGSARTRALLLLGLPAHADLGLVKAAFRRLARTLHPDLHPGVDEAQRRELERSFACVSAAYTTLIREI